MSTTERKKNVLICDAPNDVILEIIRFCELEIVYELIYVNKMFNKIIERELTYKILCTDLYGKSFCTEYFKKEYEKGYKMMYFYDHHLRYNHYCFVNNRSTSIFGEGLVSNYEKQREDYQNLLKLFEEYSKFDFEGMIKDMMDDPNGELSLEERFWLFKSKDEEDKAWRETPEKLLQQLEIGILCPVGEDMKVLENADSYVFVFHWPGDNQFGTIYRCSQKKGKEKLTFKDVFCIEDSDVSKVGRGISENDYDEDFGKMNRFYLNDSSKYVKYKDMFDGDDDEIGL